jgi:aminotransferase
MYSSRRGDSFAGVRVPARYGSKGASAGKMFGMVLPTIAGHGLQLSELAPRAMQSEIRAMTAECDRIGGINLAQGVCDTGVPEVVAEGAIRAIREGHNIYTRMDGVARLRRAIAGQVERNRGLTYDPEREVVVTSGVTGAYHAAAMALLNPGDEVLLFEPMYGYHANTLAAMRVKPVVVPMTAPAWRLDLAAVRAAITPRTRAMLINTPANPSGKVFPQAELEGLAELAQEFDLFVLTDEIYEHFVYGDAKHISPAQLPGMRERTIVMSGYSKTFAVTGWRVGYLVADAKWTAAIGYFHDLTYVCAPAPLQQGVADGIEQLPDAYYRGLAREHVVKRDLLMSALGDAGMRCEAPGGAYYILAEADGIAGATAAEKGRTLLKETGVTAVAGSAFFGGGRGEGLLRFCYSKRDAELEEACGRLRTRTHSSR